MLGTTSLTGRTFLDVGSGSGLFSLAARRLETALDPQYLSSLGLFDIVYSWGVLHHTGAPCGRP